MDRVELLRFIRESFDDNELRDLCFLLKLNYEDLSGVGRSAKARELVALCERRDQLAELETTAQQLRTDYTSGQRPRPTASALNTSVSGSVNLSSEQANIGGSVAGRDIITSNVTNITQSTAPTLRATPPRPPDHFTGREADLKKFTQLLTEGKSVAITALHGLGGIGKTSLAQKLAEQIGRGDPGGRPYFPGGVLWWTLGPNPDVITALDVWARHVDPHADLSALPIAEARAEIVRSMLAKLGKMCVIIDDVWDAEPFNVLRSAVPAGCPLLMTTRDADLAKTLRCRVERIDALSDDEAVDLLVKLLGPLGEYEDAACDIAHLTEGLPLALELIAGLADSPADLPSLAQRLRERSPLEVLKRGTTREQSIETCFTLSYEHLDADLQRRFCALGVFALAPFDRDAIAAVWQSDEKKPNGFIARVLARFRKKPSRRSALTVDDAISFLVRRSLLSTVDGTTEYRQHALLHDYALKLLDRPSPQPSPLKGEGGRAAPGEGDSPFARHADYYRTFAKTQNWREVEHAFDQIEHGWQWVQVNAPEQIIDYVLAVRVFLYSRGRHLEHLNWMKTGLEQARSIKDRKNEGVILNNMGWVYDPLGQKDKALDTDQQALAILREVGDRSGEGATLNNIGMIYDARGQLAEALDTYQQALDIHHEVGNRTLEGTTLNNIGEVYRVRGQLAEALDTYQQALAIHREVGNRPVEGTTLNNIGLIHNARGQLAEALDTFQQALDVAREVGDRSGEGTTLNNIGMIYKARGQLAEALDTFQQALDIHREVGNRWVESITLFNIGLLLDAMGRTAEAVSYLEQNVALDEAISHPDLESDRAALEWVRAKLAAPPAS